MIEPRSPLLRGIVPFLHGSASSWRLQTASTSRCLAFESTSSPLHVQPQMLNWNVTMQVGTIMAASDRFNITVLGRGGHAG